MHVLISILLALFQYISVVEKRLQIYWLVIKWNKVSDEAESVVAGVLADNDDDDDDD